VRAEFDMVAELLSDGRPFLCGERFSAADLTFAALAAAVTAPPQYGVRLPQPDELPEPVAGELRAFRDHPAGRYARALPHQALRGGFPRLSRGPKGYVLTVTVPRRAADSV
jgi:glutathione S-transferase